MKKLLFVIIVITSCYLFAQEKKDLIAYWSFNDSTATDNSGNNRHGLIQNDVRPTLGVNKKNAFYFYGNGQDESTGGHILLPFIDFTAYPEFSISMWVNEHDFTAVWGEAYIWFGDFNYGYLGIDHGWPEPEKTMNLHFCVGAGVDIPPKPIKYPYDFTNYRDNWVFYSLTYKDKKVKAYINCKLVGEVEQEVKIYGQNGAIARHWWYYLNWRTSSRFIGAIDEVKIFRKALTNKDIIKEYLLGGDYEICNNESIVLEAPDGFVAYNWSNGAATQSITVDKPGTYTVTIRTTDGDTATSEPYTVTKIMGETKPPKDLILDFSDLNLTKNTIGFENLSGRQIVVSSIKIKGIAGDVFFLKSQQYPISVNPGSVNNIEVYFEPKELKDYSDSIIIEVAEPCKIGRAHV